MIKILFFAQLVELAGKNDASIAFTDGLTPRLLADELANSFPKELIDTLKFDAVMVAINQKIADWDVLLNDGDEVAFMPPFSGG